jgi:hypothetical protein
MAKNDRGTLLSVLSPEWRLGGLFRDDGRLADYDSFTLGFANVTGRREDRSLCLAMDLSFDDLSVMGFAPVLSLRHRKTQANIRRYQTTITGVSLEISLVF